MPSKPGPGILVERPALGAVIAGRLRSVERALALAAIEAAEWPLASDTQTTPCCRCRRRARRSPASARCRSRRAPSPAGSSRGRAARPRRECRDGAPDRAVDRARHHGVEARVDALVLGRIDRLVRLDVGVALAVAVGVEDERRPALRLRGVAGLVEHLRVEPADHRAAAARPQRVVRVVAELQVVRREAGVDERVLLRLRIEAPRCGGRRCSSGNTFADG